MLIMLHARFSTAPEHHKTTARVKISETTRETTPERSVPKKLNLGAVHKPFHNINMNRPLPKLPECLNHNLNAHAKPFNPLQPKNSSNAAKSDDKNSEDPISTSLSKQSENVLQNEMHNQHDETPSKIKSNSFMITEDLIKFDSDIDLITFPAENYEISPEIPLIDKSRFS